MKTKISANEAWDIISDNTHVLTSAKLDLTEALGRRAATDVVAPIALPPFDNSAVDGFALGSVTTTLDEYRVVSTIGAGECFVGMLGVGEACRIMTGAKLPSGTKAVAMQENVNSDRLTITLKHPVAESEHIRRAGEDVQSGVLVLSKGTTVTPAHIGLLAALGVKEIDVIKTPTAAIVSTGSELVDPGEPLKEGQVYYCTGPMMRALCVSENAEVLSVAKIKDDEDAIVNALSEASAADIIIMIGGMANGLYDHGRSSFDRIGVKPVFFEGQWRPGKPLFFGKLGTKPVFGLPGNPVAAHIMFKMFVAPAIQKMSGGSEKLEWKKSPVCSAQPKSSDRSLFLRARKLVNGLELLEGQGSHQLFSLSQADAIVWIRPGNTEDCEEVDYMPIEG